MKPLPHPPLGSLHIFPPGMMLAALLMFLLCLALLLAWWLWRRRRRLRSAPTPPKGIGAKGTGGGSAFAQLVKTIRDEHLNRKTYREGCHALSAATKTHLERSSGNDAEEMTVDEIASWVNEPDLTAFFTRLRRHQFGKRPPNRDDFKKMCREAPRVVSSRPPRDGKT